MPKRSWLTFGAALVACCALFAWAPAQAATAGKDYVAVSPPQPTESGDKNEVIEFFWYRCPHCFSLEPFLEGWVKKLPQDTQFHRVPTVFSQEWAIDARIYYALEAVGVVERLHKPLFDAIHTQGGNRLSGDAYAKWVADWLAKQGVDMAKYDAAFRSFGVDAKVKRAAQLAAEYKLDGVPTIAINGRYLVPASMVGDREGMITTAQQVLDLARKGRIAKK